MIQFLILIPFDESQIPSLETRRVTIYLLRYFPDHSAFHFPLSLSRFINDREKEKGDASPVNCHLGTRQGPDIQVYRINRIPRELFSCLVDSLANNRRRHELFFIIESGNSDLSKCPAGIITVIRGHAYSRGSSFSLETCGTGPRRVTAIERSFFFPFFL